MISSILQKSMKCILQPISTVTSSVISRSITTAVTPLCFQITNQLFAEPMRKKRRLDPAIVRAREEKRKRKLEKQIRRKLKHSRQLKPIEECEVPAVLLKQEDKKLRVRPLPQLTTEELEDRMFTLKDWTKYKRGQHLADVQMIDRIMFSQQTALDELRKESEELYQEAIQIDLSFIPKTLQGPVLSPPIKDYDKPDGEYVDTSKKW